jgi:hypothetical protein
VYVGDGVKGTIDNVFFMSNTGSVTPGNSGGGEVPMLGSDTAIGKTYVSDIEKHFGRKRVREARVKLLSVVPATSNSMVALIAPVRGPGASGDTVITAAAGALAPTYADTVGMSGVKSTPSYKDTVVELTPYIAGGSGAKQNEFSINRDGETAATAWGTGTVDVIGIAPCAWVISGSNSTAGLRGTITHYVVCEQVNDYLDFIGGNANPNPLSFNVALTREEAMMVLRAVLSSPGKEIREIALTKALVHHCERLGGPSSTF